jgi:hypothetical protein
MKAVTAYWEPSLGKGMCFHLLLQGEIRMKKLTVLMLALAALASSSMGAVIFSDDFESYTTGLGGTISNVWTTTGGEFIGGFDGIGGSQGERLRHGAATISKMFDITTAVAGADKVVELTFDGWIDGYEAGEYGYVEYTTDGGGNWTTSMTLSDLTTYADYDLAGYTGPYTALSLDTATWTAGQKAGFGIRFAQVANLNTERFYIDNVNVSAVPEPATIGMLGLGALVALLVRRMQA